MDFSTFIIILILVLAGLFIFVKIYADEKLLYPVRDKIWDPNVPFENVMISFKSQSINAWYFNNFPGNKVIFFCHGNSGNISHREYIINFCNEAHVNLFIFDYRGFGQSRGNPTLDCLYKDGEITYEYLLNKHKPEKIIIWGESLGGSIASHVASKYPSNSVILMSTFSSVDDVVKLSNYLSKDIKSIAEVMQFFVNTLPSKECVKKIKSKILIIHSSEDDVIPFESSKILYDSIPHNDKMFIRIKGPHNMPEIDANQIYEIFKYVGISLDFLSEKDIKSFLNKLKSLADWHLKTNH